MTCQQKQMKAELIEAAGIIAEREEALGQEPMENIQETMFVNPVCSQQAPPQAPAASNETIFQSAIPVSMMNVEPTITRDRILNEPTIPNFQPYVNYQTMPSQPPPNFDTRNNQLFEDSPPFSSVFQIKPKEPTVFSGKMEEDIVSWLNQVNSFFNMIPHISNIQKCCYVGSCLRGAAQDWWNYEGHTHQNNWNNF